MGKGRNRNKDKDPYSGPSTRQREDDSGSECSFSTHLSFDDDLKSVQGEVDDVETIMDTLAEHVENASNKNISVRLAALRLLNLAFTSHYVPDFIEKYKSTLIDLASKNLKKTDEECVVSALILANMSIQICEEMSDEIAEPLSTMRAIVNNTARAEMVRSICALSIAITTYLAAEEEALIEDCIKSLKQAWTSLKVSIGSSKLFSASLSGWALLLQMSPRSLQDALNDYQKLTAYLNGDQLDVRITCGEIVAYVYELAREQFNDNYRFPNHQQIVETIDGYSTESSKNKTKKDKRVQRFSFRQIYSCIVDKETPKVKIQFGRESVELDSCSKKLFYDQCCEVLHGGMMRHLETNLQLREYFNLGPIPTTTEKINKFAKMTFHNEAAKYRNQVRGKQRDKRSDFC